MRMLLGLVHPTAGSATVLGLSVAKNLSEVLSKTGSIIENPTFYPYLSGIDNLKIVANLTETPAARIQQMLALVDMEAAGDKKFKQYSLGMKQRLAVAASLLNNPSLLILDEPANGLDPAGIVEMRTLMHRLKAEGKTVFISSHVLHEIELMCDRIAILNHGKVVVQGPVNELLRGANRIEVTVANPDTASEVLKPLPWITDVENVDGRLVLSAPSDRSAEVNRALAEKGIFASEIRIGEKSLEQYFLGVTGESTS